MLCMHFAILFSVLAVRAMAGVTGDRHQAIFRREQPSTTAVPGCMYKGDTYGQGQSWYDGCAYKCKCNYNATTGWYTYTCNERCPIPQYGTLLPMCHFETDPNDRCCYVLNCDVISTPTTPPIIEPMNEITATIPTYYGCRYKGVTYGQGQTWDDDCAYKCKCNNATTGWYTCTERCVDYRHMHTHCILTTDPGDECCLVPICPFVPDTVG